MRKARRGWWTAVTLGLLLAAAAAFRLGAQAGKDYPIAPVPFTEVRVADAFWAPRIETNRTVTIPFIWKKNEETGRLDNFAIAGGLKKGQYTGQRYNDTDVYKTIEGTSYSLQVHPDPALDAYLDGVIRTIAAAQEPDGYLFTARTADPAHPQPGIGDTRWSNLPVSHELYNAGHLYEAAVAHFQATGKRTLLNVALKNADLVARTFGPDHLKGYPGHQEIEMGLARLYRVTGDPKYLDLAKYFLDQRGHGVSLIQYPPGSRFAIYNDPVQVQAHEPVLAQGEAVGHAVRAMYMYSGMADVAALTGSESYRDATGRLWDDVTSKKIYLTGGVGARHDRESFGAAYELPNRTAYNETCAAIGNVFWNHRMFLSTGDSRYVDVLERVLYNGLISGVSLEGNAFFYPNPLESDGKYKFNQGTLGRAPYFDVACCPGNICRLIPSLPGYIYATRGDTLYVNLFVGGSADVQVGGQRVKVRQETRYPWDGTVAITFDAPAPAPFEVAVRIPGWARGEVLPGGLYHYLDRRDDPVMVKVNGATVSIRATDGYARIRRAWAPGDRVEVTLPMPVRRVVALDAVADDAGKVALVRGPIVYCAEGVDNLGRVLDLALPDAAPLSIVWRPDLLKGVVVVTGKAGDRAFTAIPYYAWAHRGPGEMAVWLPRAAAAR